jgi:hypothetical protein
MTKKNTYIRKIDNDECFIIRCKKVVYDFMNSGLCNSPLINVSVGVDGGDTVANKMTVCITWDSPYKT